MDHNSEIEKYKKLLDAGALSQEEYEVQKNRLESEKRAEELANQKKAQNKKRIGAILAAVIACIVLVIIVAKLIIPTTKYNKALSLIDEGKYIESYSMLKDLNGFKDSKQKMKQIWPQVNMERIQSAEIGDYVTLGAYPQSSSDYDEDIEWLVLDKKDGKLLLISKYVLDARPYNNPYQERKKNDSWESSWIREWLNSEFIDKAFDSFEQSHIEHSVVKGVKNTKKTEAETFDKMFLLSWAELETYFNSSEARDAEPTEYAILQDVPVNSGWGAGCFWLTRGHNTVWPGGGLDAGFGDDYRAGIRPALWLDPLDTQDAEEPDLEPEQIDSSEAEESEESDANDSDSGMTADAGSYKPKYH